MQYQMISRFTQLLIFALLMSTQLIFPQKLTYTVSWLGIPVVDVSIEANGNNGEIHGIYMAVTRPWFSAIYSVNNRYKIIADSATGLPLSYEKTILEKEWHNQFSATYSIIDGEVHYSNGAISSWSDDMHTLMSALLFVQHHDWDRGEVMTLRMDVEGRVWPVELKCMNTELAEDTGRREAEIVASFGDEATGTAVLDHTDILTTMLPGPGHRLIFTVDLDYKWVRRIVFGRFPLLVKAELNPAHLR